MSQQNISSSIELSGAMCRRISSLSLAATTLQGGCSLADQQILDIVVVDLLETIRLLADRAASSLEQAEVAAARLTMCP